MEEIGKYDNNSRVKLIMKKLSLSEQLELAEKIATDAHKNQYRYKHNIPLDKYIVHPRRIVKSLGEKYANDPNCIIYQIVAWLHDVLEDTEWTREDLISAGIGEEIVVMVEALSRQEGETYYNFIMCMDHSHMARKIKIADIEDNMNDDLQEGSLKDKYRLSLYILNEFEKKWKKFKK